MARGSNSESLRIYTAKLTCGTVLTYEALTFVPDVAEVVPCRRHGFCPVESRDRMDARRVRGPGRTVARRSQAELLEFLKRRRVTSVRALRQHRFTLRTVASAHRAGLVEMDLQTGRVALRTGELDEDR